MGSDHITTISSNEVLFRLRLCFPPAGSKIDMSLIAPEDLAKLGVESQLIPFIVSTTSQVEQSPDGSLPLSPTEAENLVETLDRVYPPP